MRFGTAVWILAATAAIGLSQSETTAKLAGVVFEDRNGNGARDPEEPGVQEVAVCTRSACTLSDPDGRYSVEVEPGFAVVWVSQPEGYRASNGFFRHVPADPFERLVNFPLAKSAPVREFRFMHASDTHLDQESLPRFRRLRELVTERGVDFVLLTGDLIRDALRVPEEVARERYELFRKEKDVFPVPVWVVPGNHDYFGIERHLSGVSAQHPLYGMAMYRRYLGPNYYSFDYGGIHFVGLDTIDIDDRWYYGHVDATQLEWLERDLAHVAADTPVVTFNHIPFFSAVVSAWGFVAETDAPGTVIQIGEQQQFRHVVSNFDDVLERMGARPYPLALGGHVHAREEIVFADHRFTTRFHQTAAVEGSSRTSVSGVTLYRVKDGVIDGGEFIPLDPMDDSPAS